MKKLFLFAIVVLGFTAVTFGQNSATQSVTASGTIVTPITLAKDYDMKFGTLVAAAGTVVLNPGAAPTYSSVVAFSGLGAITPTAAKFTVSGDYDNTYTISVTGLPTVVTHTDGIATMGLSAWTSTGSMIAFTIPTGAGSGTLDNAGTQSFEIGATLTVGGTNQKAGVYTSPAFSVTVAYN